MNDLLQTINQSLLHLVSKAVEILPALLAAIVILLITRFSVKPVTKLVRASTHRLTKSISLELLLVQIASVSIWVLGILIASTLVFPSLGLGDIIGFLGLSSVAIGFAFQDIFKNFLAGILLLINEPFRVKDQIIVNDYEGTVESITIRSTQIRTYQGERVVIPNAIVFTSPIHVLTHYPARRTDLKIGLAYDTPLPQARQILLTAVTNVEEVLSNPPVEIDLAGFGDSTIEFVVRYWTLPQMASVRSAKSQVVIGLKQACDEMNLNIPYPIRTVYFFDQQRSENHSPTPTHPHSN
ncbi:mechanosensitive ion channel family protein [Kovacikia minuta CCNUW1]|nr:mechanosensitive ion channel family protein [Kovacikia minuta]UBF29452.1 mechanosensitive ion channel family protein [Kovacikia minuta CCNUW1]